MNKDNLTKEEDVFMEDESWWNSLLAEEDKFTSSEFTPAVDYIPVPKEEHRPAEIDIDYSNVDWEIVSHCKEIEEVLFCKVIGFNKGGLLVDSSRFHGFVPVSHLTQVSPDDIKTDSEAILNEYVGRELCLKVIECEPERGRIVLSERAAQAAPGECKRLFESLQPGNRIKGRVTNITKFGVFVDLGGIEGLIHVSELSWGRVADATEFVTVGEELNVMVLQVESDRRRVALSVKKLLPNPWETVVTRYSSGDEIPVQITEVVRYGAFARLDEGLEGLIHISQMTGLEEKALPLDVLKKGEKVIAKVIQIEPQKQRISLQLDVSSHC
ncbi:MAG: 30S ribosomal protein S1 [Anaerolineales bacterium]|nr:30S ribosomal protein S1 [Anaerolineales bacterium]